MGEFVQGIYGNLPKELIESRSVKELVNKVINYFKLGKTVAEEVKKEVK